MKKCILALVIVAVLCLSSVVCLANPLPFIYTIGPAEDEKGSIDKAILANVQGISEKYMKPIAACLIIQKENKYTGKPISASIKEIYEHYFHPITWSQAYADGIGICKPPTNDDIRYEYPDGNEYPDPPTEPGKYKAKITVCDPETPTQGATLVEEFEILEPEKSKSKLNTIRELLQKVKKN